MSNSILSVMLLTDKLTTRQINAFEIITSLGRIGKANVDFSIHICSPKQQIKVFILLYMSTRPVNQCIYGLNVFHINISVGIITDMRDRNILVRLGFVMRGV